MFVGADFVTQVWYSDHCRDELMSFVRKDPIQGNGFLDKVQHCAKAGFFRHHGGFIRREERGVERLGSRSSLFRVYGFYNGNEFIAIDAVMKRGQKMSAADRNAVREVARIRDGKLWRKKAEKK